MFSDCSRLEYLDLSSFDTSNYNSFSSAFSGCSSLRAVDLGPDFSFAGTITNPSYMGKLPTPPESTTTGKWIRADGTQGPYTPEELQEALLERTAEEASPENIVNEFILEALSGDL